MTRSIASPTAMSVRRGSTKSSTTALLPLVHAEHRQERLLRDLDRPDPLHALLAFLLFLEQLALAGDVATVTLGQHVLAHRAHALAGDDIAADGRLDRDLEHLAGDELLESLGQLTAHGLGLV